MGRMVISENRLQELIKESIYEVLNEEQYDEGFAHWLGQTFQKGRNAWNNFKNDFKAGQNKARYDNMNRDSYSIYGDEADNFRNLNGREYATYRYNQEVDRNAKARQYRTDKYGQNERDNTTQPQPRESQPQEPQEPQQGQDARQEMQPHPSLKGQQPQGQKTQGQQQNEPQSWMRTTEPSDAIYKKRMAIRNLKRVGIVPQNGNWDKPSGWKNASGGKLTPQQKDTIRSYNKFLFEAKLSELNEIINEIEMKMKKGLEN